MPIMSCATRRSRSSTEYPFLLNPTVDGALKSISGTPPGEVEDFQFPECSKYVQNHSVVLLD